MWCNGQYFLTRYEIPDKKRNPKTPGPRSPLFTPCFLFADPFHMQRFPITTPYRSCPYPYPYPYLCLYPHPYLCLCLCRYLYLCLYLYLYLYLCLCLYLYPCPCPCPKRRIMD